LEFLALTRILRESGRRKHKAPMSMMVAMLYINTASAEKRSGCGCPDSYAVRASFNIPGPLPRLQAAAFDI